MSNQPILLVQGPENAVECVRRFSGSAIKKGISYDARAHLVLEENGIPFTNADYYFDGQSEILRRCEAIAERWSREWFESDLNYIDSDTPIQPAAFAILPFNYYFHALLRAFYFLERVRYKEGPCELWTASYNGSKQEGIFFSMEESPIPILLQHLNERWQFKVCFLDIQTTSNRMQRDSAIKKIPWRSWEWIPRRIRDLALASFKMATIKLRYFAG